MVKQTNLVYAKPGSQRRFQPLSISSTSGIVANCEARFGFHYSVQLAPVGDDFVPTEQWE